MNHSFRGRFEIKLDPKGRLLLPPAIRAALPQDPAQVVVTNNRYQNLSCLHVYSTVEWRNLERRIAQLPALNPQVQAFQRFYLSGGQPVDIDAQNRVLIPQSLRKFAGLHNQIVLVGLGGKLEIWSQEHWDRIFENLSETFEDTMSAVAAGLANLEESEE